MFCDSRMPKGAMGSILLDVETHFSPELEVQFLQHGLSRQSFTRTVLLKKNHQFSLPPNPDKLKMPKSLIRDIGFQTQNFTVPA